MSVEVVQLGIFFFSQGFDSQLCDFRDIFGSVSLHQWLLLERGQAGLCDLLLFLL